MEAIFFKILSEQWIIAAMFIWTLFFVVRSLKWWIWNYLNLIKEHNNNFLNRLDQIILNNARLTDKVVEATATHTNEHKDIAEIIKSIDKWVKKNETSIKSMHNDIISFYSK